ncbi:MAG: 2-polyprenylphenol 6-hydroxylase [Alphaproteobacteria bacterium]|nr:MAG: 2-polyprenylphenol 6-hydroxylase [Alphaproteobacteria bacterium]TAF16058.1 MAG: 2-polyprenylphenol 6-hydroxylase [Alphaproteobacteria bacterium]TAF40637.1 MAG: 2-polyprenylphenol 6-hydroxylase [Alphaproteobacteria bacterium]TAF75934.1 MAG: 2-polyprenylphenol 6-hydroxylase [Alphaproteobacteria bacterium]
MPHSLHNLASLLRIGRVLAQHNALFMCESLPFYPLLARFYARSLRRSKHKGGRRGERLAAALVELGPTFIKLGQVLSTRSDLIGEEFARDLALLQDSLPPFGSDVARSIIEAELEKPINALFDHFEDIPVAAASMAQVHFAITKEGKRVAVKILRPDVEVRFKRDLALFRWLARIMDRTMPQFRRMRPIEMVQIMEDSVHMELDLRYEAAAAVELKANMQGEEGFYVPEIDWQRTTSRVLTLERIDGIAGNNVEAIRAHGHDLNLIIEHAANAFFVQVFRDGFFHADMHPGNLFIMDDGRIAVVDFGIMGRLDYKNRVFLAQVLSGFLREDYYLVAKIHAELGIIPPHKSVDQFAMACMAIGKPILGKNLDEISVARLLAQLFHLSETFEMRLQPQLLLLQKTMMLAEGIGRSLNPSMNMWRMSEPLIMSWYRQNLSGPAMARAKIDDTLQQLKRLPELMESFHTALERVGNKEYTNTTKKPSWIQYVAIALLLIGLGWVLGAHF